MSIATATPAPARKRTATSSELVVLDAFEQYTYHPISPEMEPIAEHPVMARQGDE